MTDKGTSNARTASRPRVTRAPSKPVPATATIVPRAAPLSWQRSSGAKFVETPATARERASQTTLGSRPLGTMSKRLNLQTGSARIAWRSGRHATGGPDASPSSRASAAAAQDARSLLRQWKRRLPAAHRRRDVVTRRRPTPGRGGLAALGARSRLGRGTRLENRRGEPCGARSHGASRCRARPGKSILGHARCPLRPVPAASGPARRFCAAGTGGLQGRTQAG